MESANSFTCVETGCVDKTIPVVLVRFDVCKRGCRCASSRIKYRSGVQYYLVGMGNLVQWNDVRLLHAHCWLRQLRFWIAPQRAFSRAYMFSKMQLWQVGFGHYLLKIPTVCDCIQWSNRVSSDIARDCLSVQNHDFECKEPSTAFSPYQSASVCCGSPQTPSSIPYIGCLEDFC